MSRVDDLYDELAPFIEHPSVIPHDYGFNIPSEFDSLNESESSMVRKLAVGEYIASSPNFFDSKELTGDFSSHGEYFFS